MHESFGMTLFCTMNDKSISVVLGLGIYRKYVILQHVVYVFSALLTLRSYFDISVEKCILI